MATVQAKVGVSTIGVVSMLAHKEERTAVHSADQGMEEEEEGVGEDANIRE